MKTTRAVFLVLLALCLVQGAFGDENEGLLHYYDSEIITIHYGMGGITLQTQGQSSGIFFGVQPTIRELLQKYPESKMSLAGYERKNQIGQALIWGGLAATIYGEYKLLSSSSAYGLSEGLDELVTSYTIMLAGLVAEMIGSFVLPSSYEDLCNSVNSYNRNRIGEYRDREK